MRTPDVIRRNIPKRPAIYDSPVRLLLLITATIFVTHTIAMVTFSLFPQFPMWTETLIESLLLLILLFPVLYLFSLRPLLVHISEQQQAENVMRESEHKYRQLFESLGEAAFLIDSETGRILDANKQAESLFGYTRGEIMGMNQSKLHPPERKEEGREPLSRLADQAGAGEHQCEIVHRSGKMLSVHIAAAPLMLFGRRLILQIVREPSGRREDLVGERVVESGSTQRVSASAEPTR